MQHTHATHTRFCSIAEEQRRAEEERMQMELDKLAALEIMKKEENERMLARLAKERAEKEV